ncbi:MAG: pyridoxamine 5'-phosphate oxidase [Wenzhouxiangella sp.]|jgi:pyridoxamine 5'-phosphate oxidase|nr:pyridoxamine 5'-phosphate oxidase [Wenzhouxiangella sp.]
MNTAATSNPSCTMTEAMLARFQEGFERAKAAEVPEPTAMTLATVDEQGRPSARTMLLKGVDTEGFVFFTNLQSRKGHQLAGNPNVSLVFFWRETAEQVKVDGVAEPVTAEEADAYFASRPRGSQIGAWASLQSQPLESRDIFDQRIAEFEARYRDRDVPRPSHWSGFRVRPRRVEFWYGRQYRLHERIRYELIDGDWRESLLYP